MRAQAERFGTRIVTQDAVELVAERPLAKQVRDDAAPCGMRPR